MLKSDTSCLLQLNKIKAEAVNNKIFLMINSYFQVNRNLVQRYFTFIVYRFEVCGTYNALNLIFNDP